MKLQVQAICFFLMLSSMVFAQKGKETSPVSPVGNVTSTTAPYDVNKAIYRNALKYNDFQTAINAVFNMIAYNPNEATLKDTLTYLYYNNGQYVQSLLVGTEILEKSDTNQNILEIVAISQQNLGLYKESLESYEKLYKLTKSVMHQYKIATLQYTLKRYGECGATIDKILSSKDSDQKINISDANRQSQDVSIKAAVLNMNGVIYLELNQPELAKKSFEDALKLEPTFMLAKNNLELASKPTQQPQVQTPKK
ncbi:MAG: hypothetical protein SFW35_04365 [Chitinophagales bacterium]|nr:hypothetical protein [Chitinophagales bacterium]